MPVTIPALVLWANSKQSKFVADWQSNIDLASISFRQGDTVGVELHWVEQSLGNPMSEVVWPSSANITLALGRLDAAPTSGTYKLAYGAAVTGNIAYNADASTIQAALNGLAPIAAEGGVVVTQTSTTWRATWNVAGVVSSAITVADNTLTPTSSIGIGVARTGTPTLSHIVQVHIKQAPVAVCTSWENTDAPAATVVETHSPAYSGDNRVWRLTIAPAPKSGTLRLSYVINGVTYYTAPLDANTLSANSITAAIPQLSVIQVTNYEFDLSQPQTTPNPTVNISSIGADSSGLIGFSAKYGLLNLNSLDVELLLGGASSANVVAEVEVEMDGKRQTLVQSQAIIYNDLIDTDSYTLVEWGDVVPADSVVRFDTAQALSSAEQLQARTNIGAIASTALSAYATKDAELEARVADLETDALTDDQRAAITGAATPSATNVFVTATELAGKADATHTHAIADVTGLQVALNDKSDLGHTHLISEVDGLQTQLTTLDSGKADAIHTHTIADVTALSSSLADLDDRITDLEAVAPSGDINAALTGAELPSASNVFVSTSAMVTYVGGEITTASAGLMSNNLPINFTAIVGNYTDVTYPYEITLTINGVDYKVPARLAP